MLGRENEWTQEQCYESGKGNDFDKMMDGTQGDVHCKSDEQSHKGCLSTIEYLRSFLFLSFFLSFSLSFFLCT